MAQRRRSHQPPRKKNARGPSTSTPSEPRLPHVRKVPVVYGKPFILLEDVGRNTFEYKAGSWVPYAMSIAECRATCQVNELPQKVNQMTRYEVRLPITIDA
jgi:hypothetical protein